MKRIISTIVTMTLLTTLSAQAALADNCSGLSDCNGTVQAALIVGAALIVAAAVYFLGTLAVAALAETAVESIAVRLALLQAQLLASAAKGTINLWQYFTGPESTVRGILLETHVAMERYLQEGFEWVGNAFDGWYPVFDFQRGLEFVSLKTTQSLGMLEKLQDVIENKIVPAAAERSAEFGEEILPKLHVVIPPGYKAAWQAELKLLEDFGKTKNVAVEIEEVAAVFTREHIVKLIENTESLMKRLK